MPVSLLFFHRLFRKAIPLIFYLLPLAAFSQDEKEGIHYTSDDGTKIYVLPAKQAVYKRETSDMDLTGEGLVKTHNNDLTDHIFYRFKHYDNRNINSDKPVIFKLLVSDSGKPARIKFIREIDSASSETLYNILRTSGDWFPAEHDGNKVSSELFFKLTIPSKNANFYIEMEQLLPSALDLKKDTASGKVKDLSGSNEIIYNEGLYEKYRRLFGIELARATLPWFIKELKKNPGKQFFVQTVLRNKTDAEFVWLENVKMLSDTLLKGEIDADPEVLPNKKGDIFEIPVKEITDWMVIEDKVITGGWLNEELTRKTLTKAPWELSKLVSDTVQYELAKKSYLNSITISKEIDNPADYPGGMDRLKRFMEDNQIARFDIEFTLSREAELKNKKIGKTLELNSNVKYSYAFLIMPDGKILNPVILHTLKSGSLKNLKYAEQVIPAKKFNSNILSAVIINY